MTRQCCRFAAFAVRIKGRAAVTTNKQGAAIPAIGASLDRAHAMPLYHQIYLALRDEITRGTLALGAMVPTEHDLGARYGVSRITARRALEELAQAGFVERRRRTGTRVTYRAPEKPIEANIDQAVESLIAFGHDTKVRVISSAHVPAPIAVAARLQIDSGTPVVQAIRLRLRDGAPLGRIISYLRGDAPVDTSPDALTATPMLALLRAGGIEIGGAVQTIAAETADPELADALSIEPRAAVLRVERLVEDAARRPVLLTIAHYRADRYRITLDLHEHNQVAADYS